MVPGETRGTVTLAFAPAAQAAFYPDAGTSFTVHDHKTKFVHIDFVLNKGMRAYNQLHIPRFNMVVHLLFLRGFQSADQ